MNKMIHGGDIYTDGILKNKEILDFSSNINPLGIPPKFTENINEGISSTNVYPDIKYRQLKDNIINYLNNYKYYFNNKKNKQISNIQTNNKQTSNNNQVTKPNKNNILNLNHGNIIVGNGATEIIDLVIRYLKSITIVVPSFLEYELSSKKHDININYSYLNDDFSFNYEDILEKLKKSSGLIIANPNNPNGNIINKKEFIPVLNYCQDNNKIAIVDEAFIEFSGDYNYSLLDLINKYDCLFIIKSVTKFYGLPGIRFGYGVTKNKKIYNYINLIQNPWTVNSFAELSAKYVLNDIDYIQKSLNLIENEKKFMFNELNKIVIFNKIYKSYGNYLLIKLEKTTDTEVYNYLKNNNILIRPCSNYRGLDNKFIRIAINDHKSNEKLIECFNNLDLNYI
jgi:threonine-phosphate decarboxylase